MMKKAIFLLILCVISFLHSAEEQSYDSNWKPNEDVIQTNNNEIDRIKNQVIKRIECVIKSIKKFEEVRAINPENKSNIKLLAIIYNLNQALKFVKEHQFQKAINILKKISSCNIDQVDKIRHEIEKINNICSKWLSDITEYPDEISNIVNQYALPYKDYIVLEGHNGVVLSIAWSPDSKYIASGSQDTTIIIRNIETCEIVKTLKSQKSEGHESSISAVSWSPDGQYIASVSWDAIIIWDVNEGKEINKLKCHNCHIRSISWSPDSKHIVSTYKGNSICVWDIKTGQKNKLKEENFAAPVHCVSWSPDGEYIFSGSSKEIKIWTKTTKFYLWNTWQCIQTLKGHDGIIYSVSWLPNVKYQVSGLPNGKHIASMSTDKTVRIWDIETGKEIGKSEHQENREDLVTFSPDGKWIACRYLYEKILIYKKPFYA